MKAETHPDYHEITVVMTDGTEYKTRSTWGKEGDVLKLDVDPLTHPAWQGGASKVVEKGQLDKFEGRYGTFLSGDASGGDAPAPQKKEEPKEEAKETAEPEQAAEAEPAEKETQEAAPEEPAPAEETSEESPAEENSEEPTDTKE